MRTKRAKLVFVLSTLIIAALIAAACSSAMTARLVSGNLIAEDISRLPNEAYEIIRNNYVESDRIELTEVNRDAITGFLRDIANQHSDFSELRETELYISLLGDSYKTENPGDVLRRVYDEAVERTPQLSEFNLDLNSAVRAALVSMVEGINDPHSAYLPPERSRRFNERLSGQFVGIGARVDTNAAGFVYIVDFLRDSPAREKGLMVGDVFIAIDDEMTEGLLQDEVIARIRGDAGTTISITVERSGMIQPPFEVERRQIKIDVVSVRTFDSNGLEIGVLKLDSFNRQTVELVENALCELIADERCADYCAVATNECRDRGDGELGGLIIDLSDNPGGFVDVTIDTISLFIDANGSPAMHQGSPSGGFRALEIGGRVKYAEIPLVVLVGGMSASGSEVFTGALLDHGRAWISGATTVGKGSVNRSFNLSNGGAVNLTIERWYTPCGDLIEGTGITPEFEFATPEKAAQIFTNQPDHEPLCDDFENFSP